MRVIIQDTKRECRKELTWHKVHTATPRASKSCQRVVSCYGVISFHTMHRNKSSRLFTDGTSQNSRPQSGGAR